LRRAENANPRGVFGCHFGSIRALLYTVIIARKQQMSNKNKKKMLT
jgi:hypothetical protein